MQALGGYVVTGTPGTWRPWTPPNTEAKADRVWGGHLADMSLGGSTWPVCPWCANTPGSWDLWTYSPDRRIWSTRSTYRRLVAHDGHLVTLPRVPRIRAKARVFGNPHTPGITLTLTVTAWHRISNPCSNSSCHDDGWVRVIPGVCPCLVYRTLGRYTNTGGCHVGVHLMSSRAIVGRASNVPSGYILRDSTD